MAMAIAKVNGDHSGPRVVGTRKQFEMKLTFSGGEAYVTGGKALTTAVRDAIVDTFGVAYIATMIPMRVLAGTGSTIYEFNWVADGQKFQLHQSAAGTEHAEATLNDMEITVRCESTD